jgi:hypothetical protein
MGRITGVRGDTVVRQSDTDVVGDQSQSSADAANEILVNELVNLASKTFDTSRPVDEYNSVTSATTLEVLPEYEMDELIECIIINAYGWQGSATTGTANVVTLQLGRRLWYINMSYSTGGMVVLNGMNLRLDRSERRIITQTVAGPLSLELMGHADMQG